MPLHALAVSRPLPNPETVSDFAFDPRLPETSKALLIRLLSDLFRLGQMPRMATCCCFCAELLAAMLQRNGIEAQAVPCKLTITTAEGYAVLGPGFAQPGQLDSHFITLTDQWAIDWALAGTRSLPRLKPMPRGFAVPRSAHQDALAETHWADTHRLVWEPADIDATVRRQHMSEKLKVARLLAMAGRRPAHGTKSHRGAPTA